MKASVYTSLFNYSPDKFDLLGAFKNWSKYADEIVIATFEDQKDDIKAILFHVVVAKSDLLDLFKKIKVVSCPDTSLDDPLFDGKLKNAALQSCLNELVIQQDLDERLSGDIKMWEYLGEILKQHSPPIACLLPVIDLYKDLSHYKSVGSKFYFHLKEGVFRGVVNYAKKEDGFINVNLSDSTEPIDKDGNLIRAFPFDSFFGEVGRIPQFDITMPHVCHLGYLDLDKRIKNNKFWKGVWCSRAGENIEVATTLEKLEEENEAIPHGLPIKWWEN